MDETWQQLLPRVGWIGWKTPSLSLLESYGYVWYFTLIGVLIYNFIYLRSRQGPLDSKFIIFEKNRDANNDSCARIVFSLEGR